MLTFFRRIRKALLDSGNAGKYLLYAIGEIALVVVGILIALQINNWNTNRIDRNREDEIISLISREIADNLVYIENRIQIQYAKTDIAVKLINLTGSDPQRVSSDSLGTYLGIVFGSGLFTPHTSHFNRIINGDEINYISHDSLKFLLGQLDNTYKLSEASYEYISNKSLTQKWKLIENGVENYEYFNYWGNRLGLKGYDKIQGDRFIRNHGDLLTSQLFESLVMSQLNYLHFFITRLEELTIIMEELQEFIQRHYNLE